MKLSLPLPSWLKAKEEPPISGVIEPTELIKPGLLLFCLVALLVVSALLVIWSAHQYRVLFNQQQELVQQWDELQVEWGQLLLEQGTLAANNRVESVAIKRLGMRIPEQVEVIRDER
ncbi:cell division protein FtsL [Amphritea sp. 2_MG-2023]|uniref:cell division protein FtsL n=1 Tax=Amphritea TaxID=515417 RepID=UPI001C070C57|nr:MULTISPECIES: cell division protein FtsL [Amphritea]MBU2965196.1 cell division protein FtsL [Amphritea atlantica]MDO6419735.1 cell division protein FtsL [Amphritea sp. 2_MG-2023]